MKSKLSGWHGLAQCALAYGQSTLGEEQALADWVEIMAICNAKGKCSRAELVRRLRQEQEKDSVGGDAEAQKLTEIAFSQLSTRVEHYSKFGYPFKLDKSEESLYLESKTNNRLYLFFLALSYSDPVSVVKTSKISISGSQLFEQLSVIAIQRIFPDTIFSEMVSTTFHFGNPSITGMPGAFWEKIQHVANHVGEGRGYRLPKSKKPRISGDDGVDILHWRGFPDRRGSYFYLFCSCATGRSDWKSKRGECDPLPWSTEHFQYPFLSPHSIAKCCFLPRMLPNDKWFGQAGHAGMIIDRCRIALILHGFRGKESKLASAWLDAILILSTKKSVRKGARKKATGSRIRPSRRRKIA